MLDFNDTPSPAQPDREGQREAIRADLLARLESVLFTLFPAGTVRRGRFLIGDVLGSPGDSLEVVLQGEKAGLWTDRATGDGGDIFDLIAAQQGVNVQTDFPRVLEEAASLVGRARSVPVRPVKKTAPLDELGPATAKWDYLDAAGQLLAVVYRYDPRDARRSSGPGMPAGARALHPIPGPCTTNRVWPRSVRSCWSRARSVHRP